MVFPINFSQFMSKIQQIAAFDFYETGEIIEKYLEIESTEPFNANFEELGFESTYILNNLGTLILFFITYPMFLLIYPVFYFFRNCSRCCMTIKKRMKK